MVCLTAVTVSFGLMCWNVGAKPFWVDEAIAVFPARSILTEGLPRTSFDLNFMEPQLEDGLWDPSAPLYRYTVAAVASIFGFSETTTRGWSVFLALLSLVPFYGLARRLYGATTALLAVAFLAGSPGFADFAREARHFMFVACMMAFTFYFLVEAASGGKDRSRALWPIFLTATLLGHSLGYLALPIVLVLLVFARRQPLLSSRYVPIYVMVLAIYVAIEAKYGNTLPFLHSIGCHNHIAGCHPEPWFYLGTLRAFLTGATVEQLVGGIAPSVKVWSLNLILPAILLVTGMIAVFRSGLRDRGNRPGHILIVAWFLVPLILLSTREVKFPRYLIYVIPPMSLLLARGLTALTSRPRIPIASRALQPILAMLVVLAPQVREVGRGDQRQLRLHSRYVTHALETSLDGGTDNWQRIRAQVDFLERHMQPGDIVVSSLDDASLGYYLGQFVYGFLNSRHDDQFFLGLLAEAARRGTRLWFIDTLPEHNYCHTPGLRPVAIDCRTKYRRFYLACLPKSPTFDPTCARLKLTDSLPWRGSR
jgi:4-amino-4-deoxy-L-arabinose transferase-like glycosyltransferase